MKFLKRFIALVLLVAVVGVAVDLYKNNFDFESIFGVDKTSVNYSAEELDKGGEYKHYFSLLNDAQKKTYNAILENIETMPERTNIPDITNDELKTVYEAILYDNPQFVFLTHTCTYKTDGSKTYFVTNYMSNSEEYGIMLSSLNSVAEKIKTATDGMTAYSKEVYIHDYIIKNCTYEADADESMESDKSTAYGCLVSGRASCEGYSKAAKFLLDYVGVNNFIVTGEAQDKNKNYVSHMWNVVKIENEKYHLDVTWDDADENEIYYDYFNVTSDEINKDHIKCSLKEKCNSISYNYFVKEKSYFTSFYNSDMDKIETLISKNIKKKKYYFSIKFKTKADYKKAKKKLITNQKIYSLIISASPKYKKTVNKNGVVYYENESMNILTFVY